MNYNVVLMARVDDIAQGATIGTRSTIQPVEADGETTAEIVEMALELAPPVSEWPSY
jgi:hypothetical protein